MRRLSVLGILLLSATVIAWSAAEPVSSPVVVTPTITSDLTASEQAAADRWGLTVSEWQRYQDLMQGLRGALSDPAISPIEVLGIHARDEGERQQYAERWAELLFEDTGRVLAFQRAYHAAFRRLYPNVPLFDPALLRPTASAFSPATASLAALPADARLLLFVTPACDRCTALVRTLTEQLAVRPDLGLDLYLLLDDQADDAAVRAWAQAQAIPPALVQARRITLNHDAGLLARLAPDQAPPAVFLHSATGTVPVPSAALTGLLR